MHHHTTIDITDTRSVLSRLRDLPHGRTPLSATATQLLAERQAALLCYLTAHRDIPIERVIAQMPRIRVQAGSIPTSGLSYWDGEQWIITYNAYEPRTRQRLTILHEYKHIIDHPVVTKLYRDQPGSTAQDQMEQAADYFAGCVLVPRPLLIDALNSGTSTPSALANLFDVSVPAIQVRLMQVGKHENRQRCSVDLPTNRLSTAQIQHEGTVA